jgi:mannitol PTS system EIICBA or EIICB component
MSDSSFNRSRAAVQSVGRMLSGMVMPNIGAFIAWGFITALFIPTGWWPHAGFARLIGPTITFLLPLLIAYTGGQMVHGTRGGVIAAVATVGAIVGADIPMFIGAMIIGPSSAAMLRMFDRRVAARVPAGFEMLVNNFSLGLLGATFALISLVAIGPTVGVISEALAGWVKAMVDRDLLPIAHVLIEPAKVLFLNNAINHGIIGPLAITEAHLAGKSVLFMLESNPGPGLGVLLAYWCFTRGVSRQSAPGAVVVHFLGGIHEIYFPYILAAPRLLLGTVAGGMTGTFFFVLFGGGLVAAPSPGSIFAYIAMMPKGGALPVFAGVAAATLVSFVTCGALLRFGRGTETAGDIESARRQMEELKRGAVPAPAVTTENAALVAPATASPLPRQIVFACDAGMGSSAMGASILRKKLGRAGITIPVINCAIDNLPADTELVLTHRDLTPRARLKAPHAEHVSLQDFLKSPLYDELVARFSPRQ